MEDQLVRLKNYHIAVKEHNDKIIFLRKIIEGSGNKSYGIQVAKMAGLPISIVNRAKEILKRKFENNNKMFETLIDSKIINDVNEDIDIKPIIDEIKEINTDEITPIEALRILNDIKTKYNI